MKKTYYFLAATALFMASCANDDFTGDNSAQSQDGTMPIVFNMQGVAGSRGTTQISGNSAADSLDNEFIVWGEKTNNSVTSTVFQNYRVQYQGTSSGNTGNSSVSNTNGWEYVGIAPYAKVGDADVVSPNILGTTDVKQTIKYWDTATGTTYNFTAVSALKADITAGNVKITRNPKSSTDNTAEGYTIVLSKGASAGKIYVADKQPSVSPLNPSTSNTIQPVTMAFRNFQSKIRFGFYETVPGYKVQITKITYTGDNSTSSESTTNFYANGQFVTVPAAAEGDNSTDALTYTVTYDSNNKPVLHMGTLPASFKAGYKEFGTNIFNKNLGEASTSPVYDTVAEGSTDGKYTAILPNTENATTMSFTVDYKLISDDTQEVIAVTGKKVTVPAAYCQWKPNYAYTYLFKVSDQSAGLFPITFDAVIEADEVSKQETITEVGEPSITTFGVSSGKYVTDKDEYASGDDIYVVVYDGTELATLTNDNIALYTVTATTVENAEGAIAPNITEASVANLFAHTSESSGKWTITDANNGVLTAEKKTINTSGNNAPVLVSNVPAEDGTTHILDSQNNKALKFSDTNSDTGTYYYAIQYKKTVGENNNPTYYYKIVKVVKK